jgi:4-hydroxybenzoate polyprenyltransferase
MSIADSGADGGTSVNADDATLSSFEALHALEPRGRASAARAGTGAAPWPEAIRVTIMLGRPRTCIPGVIAYALGFTMVHHWLSGYFLFGIFMVLVAGLLANLYNVCTDLDEDSQNLPERLWLVLRIGYRRLCWITCALSLIVAAGALVYGLPYFVFALVVLLGVHQYSYPPLRLKARPLLGLLGFSLAVFGPFLLGYFGALRAVRWPSRSALEILAFLIIWFVAKGMMKNIPDYGGDRSAGLRTSATVFPTYRAAAVAATAGTLIAYLSLPAFVLAGAAPLRVLGAMPWAAVALWNCRAMVASAGDRHTANQILKRDMWLSTGFLISVLLLASPSWPSLVAVVFGAAVLSGSDLLAWDSRRTVRASGN